MSKQGVKNYNLWNTQWQHGCWRTGRVGIIFRDNKTSFWNSLYMKQTKMRRKIYKKIEWTLCKIRSWNSTNRFAVSLAPQTIRPCRDHQKGCSLAEGINPLNTHIHKCIWIRHINPTTTRHFPARRTIMFI